MQLRRSTIASLLLVVFTCSSAAPSYALRQTELQESDQARQRFLVRLTQAVQSILPKPSAAQFLPPEISPASGLEEQPGEGLGRRTELLEANAAAIQGEFVSWEGGQLIYPDHKNSLVRVRRRLATSRLNLGMTSGLASERTVAHMFFVKVFGLTHAHADQVLAEVGDYLPERPFATVHEIDDLIDHVAAARRLGQRPTSENPVAGILAGLDREADLSDPNDAFAQAVAFAFAELGAPTEPTGLRDQILQRFYGPTVGIVRTLQQARAVARTDSETQLRMGDFLMGEHVQARAVWIQDEKLGVHVHPHDEYYLTVGGKGLLQMGAQAAQVIGPYTLVRIPAGMPHTITRSGEDPLRLLIFYPAPYERTLASDVTRLEGVAGPLSAGLVFPGFHDKGPNFFAAGNDLAQPDLTLLRRSVPAGSLTSPLEVASQGDTLLFFVSGQGFIEREGQRGIRPVRRGTGVQLKPGEKFVLRSAGDEKMRFLQVHGGTRQAHAAKRATRSAPQRTASAGTASIPANRAQILVFDGDSDRRARLSKEAKTGLLKSEFQRQVDEHQQVSGKGTQAGAIKQIQEPPGDLEAPHLVIAVSTAPSPAADEAVQVALAARGANPEAGVVFVVPDAERREAINQAHEALATDFIVGIPPAADAVTEMVQTHLIPNLKASGLEEGPVNVGISSGANKIAARALTLEGPAAQAAEVIKWQHLPESHGDITDPFTRGVRAIADQVSFALKAAGIAPERLREVKISWAGPYYHRTGFVQAFKTPGFQEEPVDLKQLLEGVLQGIFSREIPVTIVHDGPAGALGELRHPEGGLYGYNDGMTVIIGGGVGSGIIQDGEPIYASGPTTHFLGEIGWQLMYQTASGRYLYRGKEASENVAKPTPFFGQVPFEARFAGPWLAARYVTRARERGLRDPDLFGEKILIGPDDVQHVNQPIVLDEQQQDLVLTTLTQRAINNQGIAREFLGEAGTEFGQAVNVFSESHLGQSFTRRIVLVGSVGQYLGLNVPGDPFLEAIRSVVGHDQVVRTVLGEEAEFLFAQPTGGLEEVQTLTDHTGQVNVVAVSSDGQRVASGSHDKTIRIWDTATGKPIQTIDEADVEITILQFSPDGKLLLSGSRVDGFLQLWNLSNGKEVGAALQDSIRAAAFHPDGRNIAAVDRFGHLKLWQYGEKQSPQVMASQRHTDQFNAVAYAPDGTIVAAAGTNKVIWLLSADDARQMGWIGSAVLESEIMSVAFSPDGQWLASGGLNGELVIWNAQSREVHRKLATASQLAITSVAFTPDSARLLVGFQEKPGIRHWRVDTGAELGSLEGHEAQVNSVVVAPDGRVISGSKDQAVKIWPAALGLEEVELTRQLLEQIEDPRIRVGLGTVLTPEQARSAAEWVDQALETETFASEGTATFAGTQGTTAVLRLPSAKMTSRFTTLFWQVGLEEPQRLTPSVSLVLFPTDLPSALEVLRTINPATSAFFVLDEAAVGNNAAAYLPAQHPVPPAIKITRALAGQIATAPNLATTLEFLAQMAERTGHVLGVTSITFVTIGNETYAVITAA